VEALRPVQERYAELRRDPATLQTVLDRGAEAADRVARATLKRVRDALGFLPPG
jgi:tryptophanyl-tRNA synthetase